MEPITAAIVAALPAIAVDTVKSGVKDAYQFLKDVILHRYGDANPVSKAITAIEADPQSKAQASVLEEKVLSIRASSDPDVLQALQRLLDVLNADGISHPYIGVKVDISGGVQTGVIGARTVSADNITIGKA